MNRENATDVIPAKIGNAASFSWLLASGNKRIRKIYMPTKTKKGDSAKNLGAVDLEKCSFFNISPFFFAIKFPFC